MNSVALLLKPGNNFKHGNVFLTPMGASEIVKYSRVIPKMQMFSSELPSPYCIIIEAKFNYLDIKINHNTFCRVP